MHLLLYNFFHLLPLSIFRRIGFTNTYQFYFLLQAEAVDRSFSRLHSAATCNLPHQRLPLDWPQSSALPVLICKARSAQPTTEVRWGQGCDQSSNVGVDTKTLTFDDWQWAQLQKIGLERSFIEHTRGKRTEYTKYSLNSFDLHIFPLPTPRGEQRFKILKVRLFSLNFIEF